MQKENFVKKYLLAVLFLTFIFVIGALYILLPNTNYSNLEKRYMASLPKFSLDSLADGSYTKDFESFMADQTPARSFFVGLDAYYNLSIGNNGSNGIYKGSNGYLIEKPVSSNNVLTQNIAKIKCFSEKVDTPVDLCVVPSKGYIYSDNLPYNHLDFNDKDFFDSIKTMCNEKVNFIDIANPLKESKDDVQLYYKTDHHWTSSAAYIAYKSICTALKIPATEKSNFDIQTVGGFYGTSYSNSGLWLNDCDNVDVWKNKTHSKNISVTISEGSKSDVYNSMFFDKNAEDADKYTVFLDGNHSLVKIENNAVKDGTLLVVKDSFAHCLVPFLADNYNKIIMVDLRYYLKPITDIINSESVDRVMFIYGITNLAESTDIILN